MAVTSDVALDALWYTVVSCLSFLFLVEPATQFIARHLPVNEKRHAKVANSLASMVHSLISGLWSNWLFAGQLLRTMFSMNLLMLRDDDPLQLLSPTHAIAFSTGYFIFDTISMYRSGLLAGSPAMIAHHIVVPLCFGGAMWKRLYTPLLTVTLMCEINSLGMHLRIVLRALKDDCSPYIEKARAMAVWFAIISFPVFRLTAHPYVLVYMLSHYDSFEVKWHYWVGLLGTIAINILNLVFGVSILKAEFGRPRKGGQAR